MPLKPGLWTKKLVTSAGLHDGVKDISTEFVGSPSTMLGIRAVSGVMLNSRQPSASDSPQDFTINRRFSNFHHLACLERRGSGAKGSPIRAYWAPQGGSCKIPIHPQNNDVFLFTPDFSGCSICVDQIDATHYRVYHVEGGNVREGRSKKQEQYLETKEHKEAWGNVAEMRPDDYGTDTQPCGFAMMHYRGGQWRIIAQNQGNALGIGSSSGKLVLTNQPAVIGTKEIVVTELKGPLPRTRPATPVTPAGEPAQANGANQAGEGTQAGGGPEATAAPQAGGIASGTPSGSATSLAKKA